MVQIERLIWCKATLRGVLLDIDDDDLATATRSVQEVLFELYAIQGRAVSIRVHGEGSVLIV